MVVSSPGHKGSRPVEKRHALKVASIRYSPLLSGVISIATADTRVLSRAHDPARLTTVDRQLVFVYIKA